MALHASCRSRHCKPIGPTSFTMPAHGTVSITAALRWRSVMVAVVVLIWASMFFRISVSRTSIDVISAFTALTSASAAASWSRSVLLMESASVSSCF